MHEMTRKGLTPNERGPKDQSVIVRGRKRPGIDSVEGVRGCDANVRVGVGQGSIGERRDCGGGLSAERPEDVCRSNPHYSRIGAFESGSKGRNGSLRSGLETAKNGDCVKLVGDVVRRIEKAGNYGRHQLRSLFEVRNPC
jgi:hypothetical protein